MRSIRSALTAVTVEVVPSVADVESVPTALAEPQVPQVRRIAWAIALVPTAALLVATKVWAAAPDWLSLVLMAGLLATALTCLLRYQDDRLLAAANRGRSALLAEPRLCTGVLTAVQAGAGTDGSDEGIAVTGAVSFPDAAGEPAWGPIALTLPPGSALPRVGDPVAVWTAAGDLAVDGRLSGAVLVRYHRGWAEEVLAAMPTDAPESGGSAGEPGEFPG